MDPIEKILQTLSARQKRLRAEDQELEDIRQELEKMLVPGPKRIRQNLKQARIEHYEQVYATGTFRKPASAKRK